jgi:predicted aspartyl protease
MFKNQGGRAALPRQILDEKFIMAWTMKMSKSSGIAAGWRLASSLVSASILFAATVLTPAQSRRPAHRKPAQKVRFEDDHRTITVPFEGDKIIVLRVRVNNSEPLKFLFDTGAGISVLDARQAVRLKLKKAGNLEASGVGGDVRGSLVKGISLSVAGIEVRYQPMAVLPLDFPCDPKDIAGIIGYDFIKEFVVEIDYEAKTLGLYDPATYQYAGHGDLIPLVIDQNTP